LGVLIPEKMANIQSAKKQLRQNLRRKSRNRAEKSSLRTLLKKARLEKEQSRGVEILKEANSALDKAVQRRLIHPNKAARHKSQISKLVGKWKTTTP